LARPRRAARLHRSRPARSSSRARRPARWRRPPGAPRAPRYAYAYCPCWTLSGTSGVRGALAAVPRGERFDLAGLTQHLVHIRGVQLLGMDQLAGEFLERDGAPLHQVQQLLVEFERRALGLERLAQHRRDVVLV